MVNTFVLPVEDVHSNRFCTATGMMCSTLAKYEWHARKCHVRAITARAVFRLSLIAPIRIEEFGGVIGSVF